MEIKLCILKLKQIGITIILLLTINSTITGKPYNVKRTLQTDLSYAKFQEMVSLNSSYIYEQYDLYCGEYSSGRDPYIHFISKKPDSKQMFSLINKFQSFFPIANETSEQLLKILQSDLTAGQKPEDIQITSFIGIVIPFLILIVLTIIGWITCCSCCCYDYCLFICKRPGIQSESSGIRWRWIPLVTMIFFGFKAIIPLMISFTSFK